MNSEKHRSFLENFDYSALDREYGKQERPTPETIDLAINIYELLGEESVTVNPYEGGVDLFYGTQQSGHLLLHIYQGKVEYSGLNKPLHKDIFGEFTSTDSTEIPKIRTWLSGKEAS